jgi:hypothetical protein
MAGKVTLYVRDDELWTRARSIGGPGGLSDLVQECLREWLDRAGAGGTTPTVLERARRLRHEADALVRALEEPGAAPRSRRRRPQRRRTAPHAR